MLPRNFFIDNRVFKSGAKNPFLNTADTKWLNDIVSQVILNTTPGNPQLPLIFQNAITRTYVPGTGSEVEWGGNLVKNTIVDGGNTYNVTFQDLVTFNVNTPNGAINLVSNPGDIGILAQNALDLSAENFLFIKTPYYSTKTQGSFLQLLDPGSGEAEWSEYAFPIIDGAPGEYLTTDGAGVLGWTAPSAGANKCEVLYFTDNPLDVSWPDLIASGSMASYTLPAGTFTTDGDYLEYEASAVVTGTSGTIPEFHVRIGVVTLANTAHTPDHAFTIVTKAKIIRVSATSYFARIESSVYSPAGLLLESYVFLTSGAIVWADPNDFIYHVQVGPGDHISELKHFVITKFLK